MKTGLLSLGAVVVGCLAGVATVTLEFQGTPESFFEPRPVDGASLGSSYRGPKSSVVNGEAFDFGTMKEGETGTHVFILKNVGDSPLEIEQRDTTCKCTVSEMGDGHILPGKSVEITLKWKLEKAAPDGNFSQVARFRTNDAQRPLLELMVHGYVDQAIRAQPETVVMNRITANEPTSATFHLLAYQAESVSISQYEFANAETAEFFELKHEPLKGKDVRLEGRAKSGSLVTITALPGLPIGAIRQAVKIVTDLPDQPPITVAIQGSVVSDISVVGGKFSSNRNLLNLGVVKQSEGAKANLHVLVKGAYRDDVSLKVGKVDPEDVLQVTLGEPDRSNTRIVRFPLTIEIPRESRQASRLSSEAGGAGVVVIDTTHPAAKQLRILVRFAVEG